MQAATSQSVVVGNFAIPVMSIDYQDPVLHKIYAGLPVLPYVLSPCVHNVTHLNSGGFATSFRSLRTLVVNPDAFNSVSYVTSSTSLPKGQFVLFNASTTAHPYLRSLLRGLRFVQTGFFVNTSCIRPNLLVVEGSYMKIAATKQIAVGIMLGVVSDCFIVDEAVVGSLRSPYFIHRITIAPFIQEMRRDSSTWGMLFGFEEIPGPMDAGGFSFSTRKKAEPPVGSSTTPTKNGIFRTVATSALSGNRQTFSSSRGFEEHGAYVFCQRFHPI
jgi:hypothetical protein